jgi:acyl-CoA reductase-like NAD-dependent aldehyde dehydrogenase
MPSSDSINTPLTPVQEQVLTAIANGASMGEAAAQVSLHRNTVGNWRRTSQTFRDAFTKAQYDRALQIHEQAVTLVTEAVGAIREILRDQSTPASVRLKAALAILQQASTPPPEPPMPVTNMHNNAQVAQPELVSDREKQQEDSPAAPNSPEKLHKSAQSSSSSSVARVCKLLLRT